MLEQRLGKKPDVLVLMTDQQRTVRDFPAGWVNEHPHSLARLKRHGAPTPAFSTVTTWEPT